MAWEMKNTYVGAKDALRRFAAVVQVVVSDAHAYLEWVRGVNTPLVYVYVGRVAGDVHRAPRGWVLLTTYLKSFRYPNEAHLLEGSRVEFEEALQEVMAFDPFGREAFFFVPPGVTVDERAALQVRRFIDAQVVDSDCVRSLHFVSEGEQVRTFDGPLLGLVELIDERHVTEGIEKYLAVSIEQITALGNETEPLEKLVPYIKGMNRAQIQAALGFCFVQTSRKEMGEGKHLRVTGALLNIYRMLKLGWPSVEPFRVN